MRLKYEPASEPLHICLPLPSPSHPAQTQPICPVYSSLIGCASCIVKSFRSRSSFISSPLLTPEVYGPTSFEGQIGLLSTDPRQWKVEREVVYPSLRERVGGWEVGRGRDTASAFSELVRFERAPDAVSEALLAVAEAASAIPAAASPAPKPERGRAGRPRGVPLGSDTSNPTQRPGSPGDVPTAGTV